MLNEEQLDYLIGVLYETAINPRLWRKSLGLCGRYANATHGVFITITKKYDPLITPIRQEVWFSSHSEDSPINSAINAEQLLDIFPNTAIKGWQYGNQPGSQYFIDSANYVIASWINEDEDTCDLLALFRAKHQQPFSHDDRLIAERFSGHFQKALRLQRQVQGMRTISDRVINALALPMLIVDSAGIIQCSNDSAKHLLNNPTHILTLNEKGGLSCTNPIKDNELIVLITNATNNKCINGAMFLNANRTKQIFVQSLPANQGCKRPMALVMTTEVDISLSMLRSLSELYNLTPAELRVGLALLQGKSLNDHAKVEGAAINTIRTHLKALFRKTKCCSQSELVGLLSRVPMFNEHQELCEFEQ